MNAVNAVRIALVSLLLLFATPLPKLSFSLVDVTTESGSITDNVEPAKGGIVKDTTSVVEEDTVADAVEGGAEIAEETGSVIGGTTEIVEETTSTIEETAGGIVEETRSTMDETADDMVEETTTAIDESSSVIDETTDIADDAADKIVQETTSTMDKTSSTIDQTANIAEETTSAIDETAETVDDTTDDIVEETASAIDKTADIVEETAEGTVEETTSSIVEETTSTIEETADDIVEGTTSTIDETTDIVDHAADDIVEETTSTVDKTVEIVDEVADSIDEATSAIDDTANDLVEETSSTISETTETVDDTTDDLVEETTSTIDDTTEIVEVTPSVIDETTEIAEETAEGIVQETTSTIGETTSAIEETTDIITDTISGTTSAIQEPAEMAEEVADPISNAIEETDSSLEDSADAVESTDGIIEEPVSTAKETSDVKAEKENDIVVKATGTSQGVIANETIGTAEEAMDAVEEQTAAGPANGTLEETMASSSLSSAASRLEVIPLTGEGKDDVKIISNPKLTEEEKQQIIEEALNVQELKEWSSEGGWKVVGMDFIGAVEPRPLWEEAIVYLHLPNNAGNPPIDCQQGWDAVIDVSLDTGKVTDAGFPTLSTNECTSAIILEEPDKLTNQNGEVRGSNNNSLSPPTRPSFIIAGTDDVISNDIYGTAASLNTPSYNSSIFGHMDSYMAFMLNQKWSTSPVQHMTQIGWLMTSIEGCVDCGSQYIGRNSTALAFTDSSVFGNLEAHNIPIFQWQNDEDLVAGTWCNQDGNYTIWTQYAGKVFNHNTNISCENPDNDSKVSNSIFFENWNTAGSSSWADHVLGQVEAHSAIVFRGAEERGYDGGAPNLMNWQNSTNEKQDCTGSRELTETIEGNLASGKTAKWIKLGDIPSAC
jgi:ElaB/YqjD/DUF883 family membrane-anchored ribosome-binding protein